MCTPFSTCSHGPISSPERSSSVVSTFDICTEEAPVTTSLPVLFFAQADGENMDLVTH